MLVAARHRWQHGHSVLRLGHAVHGSVWRVSAVPVLWQQHFVHDDDQAMTAAALAADGPEDIFKKGAQKNRPKTYLKKAKN